MHEGVLANAKEKALTAPQNRKTHSCRNRIGGGSDCFYERREARRECLLPPPKVLCSLNRRQEWRGFYRQVRIEGRHRNQRRGGFRAP